MRRSDEETYGAHSLVLGLRELGMAATVLHLGAHPDDEDGGLIAYLRGRLGVRAVYWSATRGEGGQNRAGPERGEALGIIRTWESLAARAVDGGEVLYGPFFDFGFVKTASAAFARWGRDEVVREIVRAIRAVQPLVVVNRWSGTSTDGHGHHQAVGEAALEAFSAAGDPSRFPELAATGITPWQPQKLYHSLQGDWQPDEAHEFGRRQPDYDALGYLRVNLGAFDPVTGCSHQELASIGLNRHLSQGVAFLPVPGDYFSYLRPVRALSEQQTPEASIFDGVDPTLTGLADYPGAPHRVRSLLENARAEAEAALESFRPHRPADAAMSVLHLVAMLRTAQAEVDAPLRSYLGRKIANAEGIAARCLGVSVECLVEPGRSTPGSTVKVTTRLLNRNGAALSRATAALCTAPGFVARAAEGPEERRVDSGTELVARFEVDIPEGAPLSCPYWLREPRDPYRYRWPGEGPLGLAFDEPLVWGRWTVEIEGDCIAVQEPAVRRETVAGGYRELPLQVLPPVALQPSQTRALVPARDRWSELELQVGVQSVVPGAWSGVLSVRPPAGWDVQPATTTVTVTDPGRDQSVTFEAHIPPGTGDSVHELRYQLDVEDHRYSDALRPVRRGSLGTRGPVDEANCTAETFIVAPAALSVHVVDATFVQGLRYAYVPGVDDGIRDALSLFGIDFTALSGADLAHGDLTRFETVVVGPNAYVVREDVRRSAARLLDYVWGGGTLIVQYQTYPYGAPGLAPYPITYRQPHDRVTFAEAPVTVLRPDHPILNRPNRIGPNDFEGWVHDRGLYFLGDWDRRYDPLLSCHDDGDMPQEGGLLAASYGRGFYVYAAYSFFRQIPAGVPGAVRLFANIVGLAEAKVLERTEQLRRIELFADMTEPQRYELARVVSERWPDDGSYLCRQGDRDNELFLVLDGEVEVIKEETGRVVYVAGRGEAVGELAMLADLPRSATLRAKAGVRLLAIRGNDFRTLLDSHTDMSARLIRILARKLAGWDGSA